MTNGSDKNNTAMVPSASTDEYRKYSESMFWETDSIDRIISVLRGEADADYTYIDLRNFALEAINFEPLYSYAPNGAHEAAYNECVRNIAKIESYLTGLDLDKSDDELRIQIKLYFRKTINESVYGNRYFEYFKDSDNLYRVLEKTSFGLLAIQLSRLGYDQGDTDRIVGSIMKEFKASAEREDLSDLKAATLLAMATLTVMSREGNRNNDTNHVPSWSDRDKDKFKTAEGFLRLYYQNRIGERGDLDQSTLRKIDGPLMDALNQEFSGAVRRAELRKLLPTKSERLDAKLEAALGYIPQGAERKSAVTVLGRGHRPGTRRR